MKRSNQFLPPRQSVVLGYTRRMLDETAMNANTFAMAVAERYLELVAPDVRTVPFRIGAGDEILKDARNNGQLLRRYMDGTVKVLPADLEDAWVLALPEPYRGACERDLARRRGYLPVRIWEAIEDGPVASLGAITSEFSELLEALAPALADGRICEADLPYAKRILNESDDLIGAVLAMRRKVQALLPQPAEVSR